MFAAGNNAKEALLALMDAGGQQALSLQDNRGNNVLKYALDDSEVKQLLETRYDNWPKDQSVVAVLYGISI